ncbi:MAG: DUF1501 domain-containing protein [Planctomycetaceae bacterium]|nr:DUF1501 domain-containing protein [Planctomycetaceae bacterium]
MAEHTSADSLQAWSGFLARRDVLRCGSVALASTLLPNALSGAEQTVASNARADSVIFLWMGGGVTHLDSFDPKPQAPVEIRGTLDTIRTVIPGVQFAEPMMRLAEIADELCVVRSFSHDSNDHLLSQVYTLSGRKVTAAQLFSEPNIGSIVHYLQRSQHHEASQSGLPGYIAVPGITRTGPPPHNLFVGRWLGNSWAPFCTGGVPEQPDFTVGEKSANPSPYAEEELAPKDLRLLEGLTTDRLSNRLELQRTLDRARRDLDRTDALATQQRFQQAAQLLTSPDVRDAFDLSRESISTKEAYGQTKIGQRCLLARRLVESGARFVMVDYGYDPDYGNLWDNHNAASQNLPHVSELCKRGYHLAGTDRACAALIEDLRDHGLLERTLVVFLTEFGRTPKINAAGGRDHWGMCGSIFFAGGGTRAGTVVGASDDQGAWPTTTPWGPADIAATIYEALGISLEQRLPDQFGRPVAILDHGRVIEGVF